MNLFDHPIFPHLVRYCRVDENRGNVDLFDLPPTLRALALDVEVNCISCGQPIKCFRARVKSERSRIGNTEVERRLFYAPTCPTESNAGCSRTLEARNHKQIVIAKLGGLRGGA